LATMSKATASQATVPRAAASNATLSKATVSMTWLLNVEGLRVSVGNGNKRPVSNVNESHPFGLNGNGDTTAASSGVGRPNGGLQGAGDAVVVEIWLVRAPPLCMLESKGGKEHSEGEGVDD